MREELLIALIDKLVSQQVDKALESFTPRAGPRGLQGLPGRPGEDGKDFIFEEHKEKFIDIAKSVRQSFQDLTAEQKESLRGEPGRDGADGKDGQDGKSVSLDELKDHIIEQVYREIKHHIPQLKLKFSDLSAEEISLLRGPRGFRGQVGKPGKDFVFEEHLEFFHSLKLKFSDLTEEEIDKIKLKFSQLTPEEVDSLKLKFSDLTHEEFLSLRGPRGYRGQKGNPGRDGKDGQSIRGPIGLAGKDGRDGRPGRDGADGKDAPEIVDAKIDVDRYDRLSFEFLLSDGSSLETNKIDLPKQTTLAQMVGLNIIGSEDGGNQYYFDEGPPEDADYNDGDIYQDTLTGDIYKKDAGTWILEYSPGPSSNPQNVLYDVPCDPTVYLGAAVRMEPNSLVELTMDQWTLLSTLTTMDVSTYDTEAVNALADSYANSNVIGIVQAKSSPTLCDIRVSGVAVGILSGLDVVEEYYLSDTTPGGLVTTPDAPTDPGTVLLKLGQPTNSSDFLVYKGERVVRL